MEVLLLLGLVLLSPFIDVSVASSSSPAPKNSSQLFLSASTPVSSSPVDDSHHPPPPSPNTHTAYDSSSRFNPSMAIIIVVLLSAFFFMGFFSVYVRRCTAEEEFESGPAGDLYNNSARSGNSLFIDAGSRRQDRPPQGLDLFFVNNLPSVRFSSPKEHGGEMECVVCLNNFVEGETLRLLPKCGHLFHQECVDMWLFSHTTCPLCRRGLMHDKSGSASFTRTTDSGNRSSWIDGPNASVPILSAQPAQATVEIDGRILGVTEVQSTNAPGVSESNLLAMEDLDAELSQCGSPILGLLQISTDPNAHACMESDRKLRRSHSTGHFVVRRARDWSNAQVHSTYSERWDPLCSPLFVAVGSNFHRTRSDTILSDLEGALQQEQQSSVEGWRSFFRRYKRDSSEHTERSCPELPSSSRGASCARQCSPSSSVRRAFKRLARIDNSTHILSDREHEYAQLAYAL